MTTFSALKTKVSRLLKDANNTAVSAETVGDYINQSIDYWKHKEFWFNQKKDNVTMTQGNPVVVMPSDFLVQISFAINYANQRWPLTMISNSEYDDMNVQGQGIPKYITFTGDWEVYYYPDQAYSLEVRYLEDYETLTGDETNDFLTNAERLIMYDALSRLFAEERQDDKMEAYYTGRSQDEYNNLLARTNKQIGTGRLTVYGF